MNRRDRETLKIYLLIIIFMYISYTLVLNYRADSPEQKFKPSIYTRKKGIIGKIKDKIDKESTIPSFYLEMKRIKNNFISSIEEDNPNWDLLLVISEMYRCATYGYIQGDDIIAHALYTIGSKCPSGDVSAISIAKLIDMRLNPLDIHDRSGQIIDPSYAHEVIKSANKWLNDAPESVFIKNRRTLKPKAIPPPDPHPFDTFYLNVGIETNTNPLPAIDIPEELPQTVDERLYNQSSHDSGVTPATKNNIKKIIEDFPSDITNEEIIDKAVGLCNDVFNRSKKDKNIGFTKSQLSDAHEVIVSLSPIEYSNTGITQTQILGKVLQKIDSMEDTEMKLNIEETLAKRMASGVESGGLVVCATGKISRIISVFEGVDDKVQKAISIDLVKREIGQLASKIRDDYMKKIGPEGIKAYSSELSVIQYAEEMSQILHDQAIEEYVNKLKMSPSVINPLIKTYSDAF